MKRKWWSTIIPISTKQTMTSHLIRTQKRPWHMTLEIQVLLAKESLPLQKGHKRSQKIKDNINIEKLGQWLLVFNWLLTRKSTLEKTEPGMNNPETLATLDKQDTGRRLTKHNKHRTTQKYKRMSTRPPPKTGRGWTKVIGKVKYFMSFIRHPQCYSYSQDVFDTTIGKQT